MRQGRGRIDVEVGDRVVIAGSEAFAAIGLVADGDGALVVDRLYGPFGATARRVEFRAEHVVIEVLCGKSCQWEHGVRPRDHDPVDKRPVEVPVMVQLQLPLVIRKGIVSIRRNLRVLLVSFARHRIRVRLWTIGIFRVSLRRCRRLMRRLLTAHRVRTRLRTQLRIRFE